VHFSNDYPSQTAGTSPRSAFCVVRRTGSGATAGHRLHTSRPMVPLMSDGAGGLERRVEAIGAAHQASFGTAPDWRTFESRWLGASPQCPQTPSAWRTVETQRAVRHWYAAPQSIVELTVPSARANQRGTPERGSPLRGPGGPPGALGGIPRRPPERITSSHRFRSVVAAIARSLMAHVGLLRRVCCRQSCA
jgi:hypothetical protein